MDPGRMVRSGLAAGEGPKVFIYSAAKMHENWAILAGRGLTNANVVDCCTLGSPDPGPIRYQAVRNCTGSNGFFMNRVAQHPAFPWALDTAAQVLAVQMDTQIQAGHRADLHLAFLDTHGKHGAPAVAVLVSTVLADWGWRVVIDHTAVAYNEQTACWCRDIPWDDRFDWSCRMIYDVCKAMAGQGQTGDGQQDQQQQRDPWADALWYAQEGQRHAWQALRTAQPLMEQAWQHYTLPTVE